MAFFTTGCLAVCLEGAVFAARPARLVTACQKENTLEQYSTDQGFVSDVPLFRGHVNFLKREQVSESDRLISSFIFLFQDCSFVLSRIEYQNFPLCLSVVLPVDVLCSCSALSSASSVTTI